MLFWQRILLGLLFGLFFLPTAQALSITTAGDWVCTLENNINIAGNYYPKKIKSRRNISLCSDTYLTIIGALPNTEWTVSSYLENNLDSLTLRLRRTGNGSTPFGTGLFNNLSGGEEYIEQTTEPKILFSGKGPIAQILLRFEIGNFNIHQGNGYKNIKIRYKITEN